MNLLWFSFDWTVFMSLKLEEKYIYCSKFGEKVNYLEWFPKLFTFQLVKIAPKKIPTGSC